MNNEERIVKKNSLENALSENASSTNNMVEAKRVKKTEGKVKRFFKQSGKAACYVGSYFLCQVIAAVMVIFGAQFVLGLRAGMAGNMNPDTDEIVNRSVEMMTSNMGIVLLINAILAMVVFLVVMKIRKHSFLEEVSLKKVSAKTILLAVAVAIGSIAFLNHSLDILPIPESLVEGMIEGNEELSNIPLWQSILATSVVVPILEEIVFRGFMFSRLDKAMPTWIAVIITSAVFGLVHGQALWAVWAALVGVVFNIVRIKTGSILPTMIIHILNNSYSTICSETGWYVPDSWLIPVVIIGAVILAAAIYFIGRDEKEDSNVEVKVLTVAAEN